MTPFLIAMSPNINLSPTATTNFQVSTIQFLHIALTLLLLSLGPPGGSLEVL